MGLDSGKIDTSGLQPAFLHVVLLCTYLLAAKKIDEKQLFFDISTDIRCLYFNIRTVLFGR